MKKTLFALFVALFATTGLLASEITPEGMEQLKTEWLFQCDDEGYGTAQDGMAFPVRRRADL